MTKVNTTKTSFQTWLELLKEDVEKHGVDPVCQIQHQNGTKTCLLNSCGKANKQLADDWVKDLQAGNTPGWMAGALCPQDLTNLAMSGSHFKCSLKNEVLKKVNNDLKANATGPQVLVAVVGICQLLSASAVCKLECNLQALHLANEPGQNVDACLQSEND